MAKKEHQLVLILDFGGQYNQLIARRVRDLNVYCEMRPYTLGAEEIKSLDPIGIIFTGGPAGVHEPGAPMCDPAVFSLGIPILGICYGHQAIVAALGGQVGPGESGEYGRSKLYAVSSVLFDSVPEISDCWMSHTYHASRLPEGFEVTATTENCATAAMQSAKRRIFGVQFHPEVRQTEFGERMLSNFLYNVCGATGDWTMSCFAQEAVDAIKKEVGTGRVLLALSGGVDSSVCAALVSKAVGSQLSCVFVDHGFMRKGEGDEVEAAFAGHFDMEFLRANEQERFFAKLKGVSDPEKKRKLIGAEFISVFEERAKALGEVDFLCQGTIYPDVIESGLGDSAVIKSHHNVGGLPSVVNFKAIIEPLRLLFKDEVRKLGLELGLPDHLVWRQPFPGPGLAIRVMGEITERKLSIVRESDAILREEIYKAGLHRQINQYFTVLSDTETVGVMGDERTFERVLALRAVSTTDFMTADWVKIPYEVLERISLRIVNEVPGTNRIVYDITSKPPATIEWE